MNRTLNALFALALTVATMGLALAPALQTPSSLQVAKAPSSAAPRTTELPPVFITGKRLAAATEPMRLVQLQRVEITASRSDLLVAGSQPQSQPLMAAVRAD